MLPPMEISDAVEKAFRVLQEEQIRPTIGYRRAPPPGGQGSLLATVSEGLLTAERRQRPRRVYEDPRQFDIKGTNFDLLVAIFSQVAGSERAGFVSALLDWVRRPAAASVQKYVSTFPSFEGKTSALALLAEFSIRTGHLKDLLAATAVPQMPTASLAIMLKEIEEMIALNFNLFSDTEVTSTPSGLAHLREIAERQTYSARRPGGGGPVETNPYYRQGFAEAGSEIVAAIDGIAKECKQARYWYLKGELQELPNLEVESDKLKVEGFLVKLGFKAEMVEALNAAEGDYRSTATAFELKNCLGHLRSFLEHLHRETAKSIAASAGQTPDDRWGAATSYLRQAGYLTAQHEGFASSLYTLVSDESVHPLMAEREYARLLRNVVIEYGAMFLTMLDKHGIKI